MDIDLIEYLLNNYPNSASEKHYGKSINTDWYPIARKKCGKLLCISCDNYIGTKLAKYNNIVKNPINNTYICKTCTCLFNICQSCYSYCVIIDSKKKKERRKKRYNIMYNSVKLNSLLVNIIYQYSSFDKLYHDGNDGNKYICFCPRCEKRETINKSNLY
jgi:hypothetical protein